VCVYLSEELLHEGLCPAVVQLPALSRVTDISRVQHQGQHFSLVYSDRHTFITASSVRYKDREFGNKL